eukprot:5442868-Prorocentrum_lima.AAC.1
MNIVATGDGVGGVSTCQPGHRSLFLPPPRLTLTTPGPHHQHKRPDISVPKSPAGEGRTAVVPCAGSECSSPC